MVKELNLALKQVLKTNKFHSIDELNESTLIKLNKNTLEGFVENLTKLLNNNIELCKSAAGGTDKLKSEEIQGQKAVIDSQETQLLQV